MSKKVCEKCGRNPATVPDRDRPGRPINRVCQTCHSALLRGDLQSIMRRTRQETPMGKEGN